MISVQLLKDIQRVEANGAIRRYLAGSIVEFSIVEAEQLAKRGTCVILTEHEQNEQQEQEQKQTRGRKKKV